MALKAKVDYFGLSGYGFEPQSTSENVQTGTAEAQGEDGFIVAVEAFGANLQPQVDYIITTDASIQNVVLGSVKTINGKQIALGNVTINTKAGAAPTMTATGSQIENGGTGHCKVTLDDIELDGLFHAQDFGLITVTNGQLIESTISFDGNIATAEIDGTIKASDLVGAKATITGTIVGVNDSGIISIPTVTCGNLQNKAGVMTQALSETNPNGDFPTYTFQCTYALAADSSST